LKTVLFTALHGNELRSVTGKLPKESYGFRRNETPGNQTQPEQITDPPGILGIVFIAFDSFDPFGIGNGNAQPVFFEEVEYRNPVFPGRFHADIQAIVSKQPILESPDIAIVSGKAFLLVMWLYAVRSRYDGSNQKGLVNIHATANRVYDFQCAPLLKIFWRRKAVTESSHI